MQEIWKPVNQEPFSEFYEVSNFGRVRSIKRRTGKTSNIVYSNRILKQFNHSCGYCYVTFQCNNIRKNFFVHRLVSIAFISNPNNLNEVNHIDGNKKNNSVSNLEWVTHQQNISHAVQTGLFQKSLKSNYSRHISSYHKNANPVYQFSLDGSLVKKWHSGYEAGKALSIPNKKIYMCCTGKISCANGFIWSYKNQVTSDLKISTSKTKKEKPHVNKSSRIRRCCPINQYDLDGNYIKTHKNGLSASKETGVSPTGICLSCKGKRPHSGGYIWKYADV